MASLIPPGRKFSLIPLGCLTSGILPGQRSTLSGCITVAILSGQHPTFSGYFTAAILSGRHPTLSGYLTTAILSARRSTSSDISHSAPAAGWERRTIQLPRADMSRSFDNGYPDSICGQRFTLHPDNLARQILAIRRIHFRPQSKSKLRQYC